MSTADLVIDGFGRVLESVRAAVDGLTPGQLGYRPDADSNSIAWLAWHLTRIQDDHVSGVAGAEQVWTAEGWMKRFGLPFDASATGYGQTSEEVAQVQVQSADLLLGYLDAVHARTIEFVRGLNDTDWERVVDERWDPPVTMAVRLVSVITDDLEHAGQAAYVRGIAERAGVR